MDKVQEIRKLLVGMSTDELRTVAQFVKHEREVAAREIRHQLSKDDKVEFDGGRERGLVQGVVVKVNPKNVKVRQTNSQFPVMWSVNPSLLRQLKFENKS